LGACIDKLVTDEMLLTAAHAIAEQASEDNLASELIYQPRDRIFGASLLVASGLPLASSIRVWRGRLDLPMSAP
jgi:malic enzyme